VGSLRGSLRKEVPLLMRADARVLQRKLMDGKTRVVLEVDHPSWLPEKDGNFCFVEVDANAKTCKQNRAIHALFADIARQMGESRHQIKMMIKQAIEVESWADATREQARDAIDIVLELCKEHDITLSHKTWQDLGEKQQFDVALHKKVCIVCGKKSQHHHIDPIGRGRDRKKVDPNNELPGLPVCSEHHTEIHTIGVESFEKKYHLTGICEYAKKKTEDK